MNRKLSINILSLALLFFFIAPATAKIVERTVAEKAARNFMYERLNQKAKTEIKNIVVSEVYTAENNGKPLYYAVSFKDGGFVLITAEDNVKPIIGYSPDGFFKYDPRASSFIDWMKQIDQQVIDCREKNLQATPEIAKQWSQLTSDNFINIPIAKGTKNVEPFIMSKWDQGKYYNSYCPVDPAGEMGRALTGCVATAMAQIIYYYRFPTTGLGIHTYSTNSNPPPYGHYGTLSVNYANQVYNYDGMVLSPTEANLDIAKLMYHAGVSVSMKYGPTASGAITADCVGAMTSHWKYSNTINSIERDNYQDAAWKSIIEAEIDARRPVLYSGNDNTPGSGHAFVLDGYQTGTTTMYHFNWGWSGNYDGFYDIDNMNPAGSPTPFNSNQALIRGIYPSGSYPYYCTGQHEITAAQGTIEDGSSNASNYQDNSYCTYLIAPIDSVNKFTLSFNRFATEANNDVIKVYDGADTNAPLLLTHSGDGVPATNTVMSTSNRMFITFKTDGSNNDAGWLATFKPSWPSYCTAEAVTAPSGTITDGSGSKPYNNSITCTWLIQPPNPNNQTLLLNFTSFETESGKDFVRVYDAISTALLGEFSGTSLPPTLVSPSGEMYIEFQTNYIFTFPGWSANYSLGYIGIDENIGFEDLKVFPNPAQDRLNISFNMASSARISIDLISMTGQNILHEEHTSFSGNYNKALDLSTVSRGVYNLRMESEQGVFNHKVVIQ